ncbi:MAG: protein translocase SEC61 complex subunit gamma [Promethearchaeota archaeon]
MSNRVSEFWENTKRIVQLSQRPTRQEMWMQFKLSMLGLFVVGVVGFFIRLIMIVVTNQFGL